MNVLGYVGRYFLARWLWQELAAHQRPAKAHELGIREGDELILHSRGLHLVMHGGRWQPVEETPK